MVREALDRFHELSPQDQTEHRRAQAVSWVYGEAGLAGHTVTKEQIGDMIDRIRSDDA